MALEKYQTDFIAHARETGTFKFAAEKPFTLKSGRPSVYFYTAAEAVKDGKGLVTVGKAHAARLAPYVRRGEVDVIHGPAYNGIALATMAADHLASGHRAHARFCFDVKESSPEEQAKVPPLKELVKMAGAEIVDEIAVSGFDYLGFEPSLAAIASFGARSGKDYTFVLGQAYGGIVPAAALAGMLFEEENANLRWGFARKEPKGHGDPTKDIFMGDLRAGDRVLLVRGEQEPAGPIVGELCDSDRVALIDDVTTTGKTKFDAWKKLSGYRTGLRPVGVFIQFDRQETTESGRSTAEELAAIGLPVDSILQARPTMGYLRAKGVLSEEQYALFQRHQQEFGAF